MAIFSNQATLTFGGTTTVSNVVTGEVLDAVTVTKEAVADVYAAGDTVTYTIAIVNNGSRALTALTVTDDLGAPGTACEDAPPLSYVDGSARLFVNGTLEPSPTVTLGPPLTFSGLSIPVGGSAVLIYRVAVTEFAPLAVGSTIVNTATVTGEGCLSTPVTASETLPVAEAAQLSITKSLCPGTVPQCGEITYTLVITNTGNTDTVATDDLAVSDTFLPVLTDLSVALDGTPLTLGTDYTYDEASGIFSTTPGRINVPAATFATDPETCAVTVTPGTATLTVTGTI